MIFLWSLLNNILSWHCIFEPWRCTRKQQLTLNAFSIEFYMETYSNELSFAAEKGVMPTDIGQFVGSCEIFRVTANQIIQCIVKILVKK